MTGGVDLLSRVATAYVCGRSSFCEGCGQLVTCLHKNGSFELVYSWSGGIFNCNLDGFNRMMIEFNKKNTFEVQETSRFFFRSCFPFLQITSKRSCHSTSILKVPTKIPKQTKLEPKQIHGQVNPQKSPKTKLQVATAKKSMAKSNRPWPGWTQC